MGREELDRDDPFLTRRIQAYRDLGKSLGSDVVVLDYPNSSAPVQVFVGTNHAHEYPAINVEK